MIQAKTNMKIQTKANVMIQTKTNIKGKEVVDTPVILLCGFLGSGKTTVLSHLLSLSNKPRVAVLMNEFGDVGVDTILIRGKNVYVKELLEGCVCCSLVGEFKAAISEIISTYHPDYILVETTGIAEADNLVLDVSEIPFVRLHAIVTVVDAHLATVSQQLGYTISAQIKVADIVVLNKIDLVSVAQVQDVVNKIKLLNSVALVVLVIDGKIEWRELLAGRRMGNKKVIESLKKVAGDVKGSGVGYDGSYVTFSIEPRARALREWKSLFSLIPDSFERVKGVVKIGQSSYVLNFVRGRGRLIKTDAVPTSLVVIGKKITLSQVRRVFC